MGSEREYVLKWHSFSSTIQSVFRRLLENSAFADVTLAVDNETLLCHRLVLSACSTYFESLLTNHPNDHPIIILLDIPHTVVAALVKFMYSGEIRLPQDQLQCFLKAAETLRIKGLTETEAAGDRLVDVSQPPPLVPAAPGAVSTPGPTAAPVPRPSTAWIAPVPASKRRTPEPAHDEDSPPRDLSAPKRRRARVAQSVHSVHLKPEPEPELDSESEPEPLSLTIKEEPAINEVESEEEEQVEQEEEVNVDVDGDPAVCAATELGQEPSLQQDQEREDPDEDELEEEEEAAERAAADEEEEESRRRRLEEDFELVSGETTEDGAPESPVPAAEQPQLPPPPLPPPLTPAAPQANAVTAAATVQSASEAAASALISSCGADGLPWKDPRWTSLLPEEKVMEAMGNMLDVPTLAAKLMKNLFTEEERINSNTTGDHGKQIFDKEKMDLIKSIVFHVSKISEDDQFGRDDLWVRCKMKIDKWNRDLRYARKKKDKDTSLPTMVKLEYSGTGRDDDLDREPRDELSVSLGTRWETRTYGLQSPPVAPQCSADV